MKTNKAVSKSIKKPIQKKDGIISWNKKTITMRSHTKNLSVKDIDNKFFGNLFIDNDLQKPQLRR